MGNCIFCGAPLDDDALFCSNCGKKVEFQGKKCPQCGAEVENDSAFCTKCGIRLDAQTISSSDSLQVAPSVPLPQENREVNHEKNRIWWYLIGGIVVGALLALGWYWYSNTYYDKSGNLEALVLTHDEESFFIERVKRWDKLHNNREFNDIATCPYTESVYFYGTKMSGTKAVQKKQNLLAKTSDYSQKCTNIIVTKISEKLVVCDFDKHTHSKGKNKVYRSYLYFSEESEGTWKIIEESDKVTDYNLERMREKKNFTHIVQPITLQFIREYCDYLELPYNYWNYVEKEIKEHNLNVLTIEGPEWEAQPCALRGRIAMDYKYKKGNDALNDYVHYYNYVDFCDAIGKIKDVWNIIPVRIESDDENESPLFQFRYEENGLENVVITAIYVEEGEEDMDGIKLYHYKYIREDNKKEVKFDLVPY